MALQTSEDRFNGVIATLAIKAPCVAVATTPLPDLEGLLVIDGHQTVEGERVLVVNQTDPIENGIYCAATTPWLRAPDFDGNRDVTRGTIVNVDRSSGFSAFYEVTTVPDPVIDTDPINFRLWYDSALFTQPGFAFCDFTICNQVLGSTAGAVTINYRIGQGVTLNLTEDVTSIVFQNVPVSNVAQLELDIRQDSTPRTIAWPASILWPEGTQPDISTALSITQVHLRSTNGGSQWLGTYSENHA